jgi:DNA polymerase III subunit gamma/tau
MDSQKLNLARKWRSQTFDQIVGQELSVKMLKNSLYIGHFFPVYLFSGQRGCGKTSMARIFAAAINCENLEKFKTSPHASVIPCLDCVNCQALKKGRHPDFIEMDAASHTGVDNIRTIIEASTFMPLMGSKKIYLIDEAHMLSKAAFNAFLKVLEEPPMSVIFILATTDPEKIIETVKSRCFQLFFKPIDVQQLINHLQNICFAESIVHDRAGLELIVKESEGSVRDALNLLEQVRFSSNAVTLLSVSHVLGHVDDRKVFALVKAVLAESPQSVIVALSEMVTGGVDFDFVWKRIIEIVRAIVWYKHGIKNQVWSAYESEFAFFTKHCSVELLHYFLYSMHKEYNTFIKTSAQHAFLEMVCMSMAHKINKNGTDNSEGSSNPTSTPSVQAPFPTVEVDDEDASDSPHQNEDDVALLWKNIVSDIVVKVENPLLKTVLQQSVAQQVSDGLVVHFPKDLQFFSDVVEAYKNVIKEAIKNKCNRDIDFKIVFASDQKRILSDTSVIQLHNDTVEKNKHQEQPIVKLKKKIEQARAEVNYREQLIDVSDKESWKKTHMILEIFPGRITEICEKLNE